jgi:hypothetical protein
MKVRHFSFTYLTYKNSCFSAFPDSNVFEVGDQVFNIRVRASTSKFAASGMLYKGENPQKGDSNHCIRSNSRCRVSLWLCLLSTKERCIHQTWLFPGKMQCFFFFLGTPNVYIKNRKIEIIGVAVTTSIRWSFFQNRFDFRPRFFRDRTTHVGSCMHEHCSMVRTGTYL